MADAGGASIWWTRVRAAPIWAHVLVLAGVLLLAAVVVSPSGLFSSDEGAPLLTAELLRDGRGWTVEHPLTQFDPTGDRFFLSVFSDGGPTTFSPYGKHPLYPVVLVPVAGAAGAFGAMLLSAAGTLLAALAASRLAAMVRPGTERLALWVTGLFSPLFFDAHLVIAHSLGAACCGWLTWSVLSSETRAGWRRLALVAGAGMLMAVAVLLRTEAVLYAAALAAALGFRGLRARRAALVATAAWLVVVTGLALLVERRWYATFMSTEMARSGGEFPGILGSIAGRLEATMWTLVAPTGRSAGLVALVAVTVSILVAVAGLRLRSRTPRWADARSLLVVAAVAAVIGMFVSPDAISGLLAAFPLLTFAVVQLRRSDITGEPSSTLVATSLIFTAGVLATTYSFGGAAEWGARFLAISLPAAIAVIVQPIGRIVDRGSSSSSARQVAVLALVISLAFSVISLRALVSWHRDVGELVDRYAQVLARDDIASSGPDLGDGDRRPIVLSEPAGLGRYAWEHYDQARGLVVGPDDLPSVLDDLAEAGTTTAVLLSVQPDEDRVALEAGGWEIESVELARPGEQLLVLRRP